MLLVGDRPQFHDFPHRLQLLVAQFQLFGSLDDAAQAPHEPFGQFDLLIERNADRKQRRRDDHARQVVGVADSRQKQALEAAAVGGGKVLVKPGAVELDFRDDRDPLFANSLEQRAHPRAGARATVRTVRGRA